ncbi:conserved hypothetical protein [Uncinocarpus reesii 1704]|uniref:Spindle pole body component n=1 Tax=Uncinocarpus reesii (strain UAMH 1704) TaxID=336963 RepID=C4JG39_UNCRE|nr:uncharacterized protein UREG_02437 [Uncinocarpus reesii 1704]EEP77588.1 conserved hypothetical protein [Uncinocarpus reesii 1704]
MTSPSNVRTPPAHGRGLSQSGPRPRVVSSNHANNSGHSRHERVVSRGNMPIGGDAPTGLKSSTRERDYNAPSELRTERSRTATRDKVQVRTKRPVREPVSTGGKGDWERHRAKASTGSPKAKEKEPVEAPWTPKVSLIPHSAAPLSCRVSVPPLTSSAPQRLRSKPLKELSMDAQEAAILQDLLFVFMGYEGEYIHFANTFNPDLESDRLVGPSYQIMPGLDPSLRDLTMGMLKTATHYSAMEAFVEVQSRAEFGAVNHALCAAIRKLLKDYLILIAQLESQLLNNPNFTLHVLHLHTMPTAQSLSQLYSFGQDLLKRNSLLAQDPDESIDDFDDVENILEQLREGGDLAPGGMSSKKFCKGGNVLGLLTQRLATFSGDPATKVLLQTLLRESSKPYMRMLNEWLHHGEIKDPHAEFLIKEQKGIKRDKLEEDYTDEYWDKRYTIRETEVPPQLESVKDKVLLAGKYLNVVRECGGVDISKEMKDVPQSFDDPRFLDNVNGAYTHANASLLNLLLTKNSLTTRFRSLKHYFFLDRSDFFSYFLELGTSELRKPAKSVNEGKLQSLLDIVLRQPGSIAAQDPFKEDVKVRMNQVGLTKWLMRVVSVSGIDQDNPEAHPEKYQTPAPQTTDDDKDIAGFDALELDYLVPFPLSLVISRKTVLRYQLVFRHLLSLRYLESLLVNCWQDHIKVENRVVEKESLGITGENILMDRVNGDDAEGSEVMVNGTKQVNRTVDELMQDHVDFLDTCLKESSSLARNLAAADPDLSGTNAKQASGLESSRSYDPSRLAKLEDTLKRLNYFAATESVVLLKLAHALSAIMKDE